MRNFYLHAFKNKGFSLIETLLVVSLMAILFGLGTIVYSSVIGRDQLGAEAQKLSALIFEARTKTINGFSLGTVTAFNFGIYFGDNFYVLFPGLTYNPNETRNQRFSLSPGVIFKTVAFTDRVLIFEKINGQVGNFDPEKNYVVLSDSKSNREKRISISRLGVVGEE